MTGVEWSSCVITVRPFANLFSRYSTGFGRETGACRNSNAKGVCETVTYGKNHKDTKTQRKAASKNFLRGLSLCLCVFVVLSIRHLSNRNKPGCERPALYKGCENGGGEWVLRIPMDDIGGKPECDPEQCDHMCNQHEKGIVAVQQQHACNNKRPEEHSCDERNSKRFPSWIDCSNRQFIKKE